MSDTEWPNKVAALSLSIIYSIKLAEIENKKHRRVRMSVNDVWFSSENWKNKNETFVHKSGKQVSRLCEIPHDPCGTWIRLIRVQFIPLFKIARLHRDNAPPPATFWYLPTQSLNPESGELSKPSSKPRGRPARKNGPESRGLKARANQSPSMTTAAAHLRRAV